MLLLKFVVPADPRTKSAAHHVIAVGTRKPRQFLGKKCDALPVAALHASEVGAPEEALRAECIEDAMQPVLDVAEWIGLCRIMRRAGRLHRDIRQFRERHQLIEMDE